MSSKTKPKQQPKPAVTYRRVSTDRQNDEGIGLDLQKTAIDGFASAAGYLVVEEYVEGGVSGGATLGKRPALRSALDHARRLGAPLIVDGLSRLSRDTSTMEEIVREFGVQIVSARDGDVDEAIALGQVARAQKERELIGERTRNKLQQLKSQGVVLGNQTNLGEAQKRGAESNVIAKRQKALEILHVLDDAGLGDTATAREVVDTLNQRGVVTRTGLTWNKTNVRGPLREARLIAEEKPSQSFTDNPNFGRFA